MSSGVAGPWGFGSEIGPLRGWSEGVARDPFDAPAIAARPYPAASLDSARASRTIPHGQRGPDATAATQAAARRDACAST